MSATYTTVKHYQPLVARWYFGTGYALVDFTCLRPRVLVDVIKDYRGDFRWLRATKQERASPERDVQMKPSVSLKLTYCLVAVVEPPAASIFSTADLENLAAVTFSLTLISPSPSTLTGCSARTRPAETRIATAVSPPRANASAKPATLPTWRVIVFGFLKPVNIGRRM